MILTPFGGLATGAAIGFSAGIAPGPLLTLVISETLNHGWRSGVRVASAPLLTDIPIILASLLLVGGFSGSDTLLGVISLAGACYLAYLGWESLGFRPSETGDEEQVSRSLRKGVITNLLNPHPYVFWLGVGAPLIIKGWRVGWSPPAMFLGGFFACLVGTKVAVALATSRFSGFLRSRAYIAIMRILGLVLFFFAALFLRDGLRFLDWL